jgi:ABC-type microcin C transport system duplicated ATPase subunit YejF
MEMLEVVDLSLTRRRVRAGWIRHDVESETIFEGLSFSLARGASLALVGEDKPGLLELTLALLRLRPIASGSILLAGVDVAGFTDRQFRPLRRRVQTVFPDRLGQLNPGFTLNQSFREVLNVWHPRKEKEEWSHRIESVMIACGLPEALRGLYPVELDAVERQQAALARALLPGPELLICHGLTEGLDAVQQAELLNRVRELREDFGLSLLVTTDDLAVAHHLGETIAILHRGRIVETGLAEAVLNRPEHDYTRRLVGSSL